MMKIHYFCDGCGSKLSNEEATAAKQLAVESQQSVAQEVFCPDCSIKALDYWRSKAELYSQVVNEGNRRVLNHRNKFFSRLEVVNEG